MLSSPHARKNSLSHCDSCLASWAFLGPRSSCSRACHAGHAERAVPSPRPGPGPGTLTGSGGSGWSRLTVGQVHRPSGSAARHFLPPAALGPKGRTRCHGFSGRNLQPLNGASLRISSACLLLWHVPVCNFTGDPDPNCPPSLAPAGHWELHGCFVNAIREEGVHNL